jgi:uncharacterized protein (TIGR02246 family)
MWRILLPLVVTLIASCEKRDQKEVAAENEVRQSHENYVRALNQKDMNTLLDLWADEAVYRNPVTGKLVQGKENIKKEYNALFNEMDGTKLNMKINSISFPFEDKAVVEGVMQLKSPEGKTLDHEYSIIYVKRKGKWKILNLSEINLPKSLSYLFKKTEQVAAGVLN